MSTIISSKALVTLRTRTPKRRRLKKSPTTKVIASGPAPFTRSAFDEKRARAVLGCMKEKLKGKTVEEWLDWIRGPVELPPHATRHR